MAIDRIARFTVQPNKAGHWFWHEVAGNGEVIGTSGQSFASQADAMRACENAKARAGQAPIVVADPHQAFNDSLRRVVRGLDRDRARSSALADAMRASLHEHAAQSGKR